MSLWGCSDFRTHCWRSPIPPQHCSWLPSKDRDLSTQTPQGSTPAAFGFPWDALLSSRGHPELWNQPRASSAQSRAALCPSSCLVHSSEGSRDQDKPRKVTLDEAARVAAEVEPIRPAETQKCCNTPNTSTSPVATALSQTQGCREGREPSGNASRFGKCCQCFIRDCHSKIPPRRSSLMVAASPGDSLPQNWIFRGQARTRGGDSFGCRIK